MPDPLYSTDLSDAAWRLIARLLPAARAGGRLRTTNLRAVLNAIFYMLRTRCPGRLLPQEFPPWGPSITTSVIGRMLGYGPGCDGPCTSVSASTPVAPHVHRWSSW